MKNLAVVILFSIFSFSAFAYKGDSTEVVQKTKHELSLNATFFVKQFFNFSNNNNIAVSPYAVSYKLITPNNNAFRTSIGLFYSGTKDPIEDSNDKIVSSALTLDYRLGYEHRFKLGKKWIAFAGIDVTNSLVKNTTTRFIDVFTPTPPFDDVTVKITSNDQIIGFGVGPVVGVQINFTPRISLFTESSFLFNQSFLKSEVVADSPLVEERKDKSSATSMQFVLPTSLFFAFKF